ncbi:MAG: hypothetical protein E6I57_01160 [Chloroflexi bacterium]|nr:MAG: hypothetical protein E6I57_01160 [Chloroflexota bacterium]
MANRLSPGRAYRAYRFPHRKGGRLSRRPGSVVKLGPLASGLSAFMLAMLAMGGVAAAAVFGYFAADLPAAHDLASVPIPLSTHIYDRSGEHLLYTLEEERRELIGLDKIPQKMQDATVSIEDKSFWSNPGIDVGGIIRAFNANQASGKITQGGSTITQQLIKTRLLGDDPTFTRKIKEAILAVEATRTFSKKQILEMYFNQIYYGNQAYGIRAAAKTYFGITDLSKLTLGQEALLAGLPQAPSAYEGRADQGAGRDDLAVRAALHVPRARAAHSRRRREGRVPRRADRAHEPRLEHAAARREGSEGPR